MARGHLDASNLDLDLAVKNRIEPRGAITVLPTVGALAVARPAAIAVAGDEDALTVQWGDEFERFGDTPHREVAEDHHLVVGRDGVVPGRAMNAEFMWSASRNGRPL